MTDILINKITELESYSFHLFLKESNEEGYRFLERLVNEYLNGSNTFSKPREALYGAFTSQGELVGIGGVNLDPFSNNQDIGRLRRFYISKSFRREGLGSQLLYNILQDARRHFRVIVLHTDTGHGDQFYQANGFIKGDQYPKATHYLLL